MLTSITWIRSLFTWKFYLPLIIIAIASFAIWHSYNLVAVKERVKQEVISEYVIKLEAANQEVNRVIKESEIALNEKVKAARKEKNLEIDNLSKYYTATIAGLQQRSTRQEGNNPSGNTGDSTSGEVCTGKGLFREDAEFLAGEAASADRLRVELASCYQQYNAVRDTLEELRLGQN